MEKKRISYIVLLVTTIFSTSITESFARGYKVCGRGDEARCYTISQAKGKKNCQKYHYKKPLCKKALKELKSGWYICGDCHRCEKKDNMKVPINCYAKKFQNKSSCEAAAKKMIWLTGRKKPC